MREASTAPPASYACVPFTPAVLCGMSAVPFGQCQHIYQAALAQTQAVLRPSWIERDVLGVWN